MLEFATHCGIRHSYVTRPLNVFVDICLVPAQQTFKLEINPLTVQMHKI